MRDIYKKLVILTLAPDWIKFLRCGVRSLRPRRRPYIWKANTFDSVKINYIQFKNYYFLTSSAEMNLSPAVTLTNP